MLLIITSKTYLYNELGIIQQALFCIIQWCPDFKIEEFSSKIKQIHFWYFWEKQVSLTEFIHMSTGKQNLDEKKGIWVSYLDLNFTLLL